MIRQKTAKQARQFMRFRMKGWASAIKTQAAGFAYQTVCPPTEEQTRLLAEISNTSTSFLETLKEKPRD